MRTLSAKKDEIKLRELIDAAREEPVTVLADGERAVVVLSPVSITTRRPAAVSAFSASGVVALTGSAIAIAPAARPSTAT